MLNINKILLPVDFPVASFGLAHEAATLARHFNSEMVILHVMTARSHAAGVPEDSRELARWDLLAAITRHAQNQQDSLSGRSSRALPFGASWSMATWRGPLCKRRRRKRPT